MIEWESEQTSKSQDELVTKFQSECQNERRRVNDRESDQVSESQG